MASPSPEKDEATTAVATSAASSCTNPSLPPSRYRLPFTSMVGKRLRKCTWRPTPSGGVQSYLGGVQLHSYSSSTAHDCCSC